MMWKTNSHLFTATMCQHTGKPCPALAQMACNLAKGMSTSTTVTSRDFEIEGSVSLGHCATGCNAVFSAGHDRIRVFCDVPPETEIDQLDQFADMLLSARDIPMPSGSLTNRPCAILEAIPIDHPNDQPILAEITA